MSGRYDAGAGQGAFEPGSRGQVLRNKLGLTDPNVMAVQRGTTCWTTAHGIATSGRISVRSTQSWTAITRR